MRPLDFDYEHIRDQGVSHLMPLLEHLSTETIITAALCWPWGTVTDDQRLTMQDELLKRGFPQSAIDACVVAREARSAEARRWVDQMKSTPPAPPTWADRLFCR